MAMIGIDLGTTNSLAAYWDGEKVVMIPNGLGSNLTPSAISMDENDMIHVGQVAKERMITHPQMSAAVFKRFMGTKKTYRLGRKEFLPEELSAFVIRSLKADAEAYLGERVVEAVISVPAYFNDAQRRATKRAGELAGLKVERLISEPTAAAMAYGLHQKEAETKFLVFDLGGGTFDVSVVEVFENLLEVKAVAGDNYLGGEDFSQCIMDLCLEQNRLHREKLSPKIMNLLQQQAELCKQALSQSDCARMEIAVDGKAILLQVGREEFAAAAKPLISRLRQPVERALRDAGLRPDELDAVVLVGGATRMTMIHGLVSRLFGRFPSCNMNPDEVVAAGAAIQAAMKERNAALKETVLTDVCSYTLGIQVAQRSGGGYESGFFAPIIERNSLIPVSRVERFNTLQDNQRMLDVEIYQGESRHTKHNVNLGKLKVEVPPAPAGEQAIDVRFTYDINGILEVEVTVVRTGAQKRLVIEESPGMMTADEIKQRLAALENIKIHPRDRQENQLLLAWGERLHEELLGEARQEIAVLLHEFEEIISRQYVQEIKVHAERLRQRLAEIEERQKFLD